MVLAAANGTLRDLVEANQTAGPCTARVVKYIAKRAAKNMSSLESQTIVPTATRLGRLTFGLTRLALDMGLLFLQISVGSSVELPGRARDSVLYRVKPLTHAKARLVRAQIGPITH